MLRGNHNTELIRQTTMKLRALSDDLTSVETEIRTKEEQKMEIQAQMDDVSCCLCSPYFWVSYHKD